MPLLDQSGNPLPKDPAAEPVGNGQNHDKEMMDVRACPTGTLFYNLIKVTLEETGIGNAIAQLKAIKEQQKMVADPPQMTAMQAHLREMEKYKFIFANEINQRFALIDKQRREQLGIAVVEPAQVG